MILRILVAALMMALMAMPASATEQITAGYPSNSARTKGEMKQFYEDVVSLLKEVPGGIGSSIITLASDTFALPNNQFAVVVAAQTGTTDNINTVTGNTRDGRWLVMRADAGDQITINHLGGGSGQFFMQDGQPLVITEKTWVIFQWNEASLRWEEIARDGIRMPGGSARSTIVLDTNGYATPTGYAVTLDTFASAATDNADRLVTTNKVPYVLVRQANAGRVVTLRHNIGGDGTLINRGSANITFSNTQQAVLYERVGTTYEEVERFGFDMAITSFEFKNSNFTAEWGKRYAVNGTLTVQLPLANGNNGIIEIQRIGFGGATTITCGGAEVFTSGNNSYTFYQENARFVVSAVGTNAPYLNIQPFARSFVQAATNRFYVSNNLGELTTLSGSANQVAGWDGSGNPIATQMNFTASAEQTVSTGSSASVSHSLGRMPYDWFVVLRCKTADAGYAVGDEIRINCDGSTANRGFTMWANTTQVGVSASNVIDTTPKGGGSNTSITVGSWRWVFYYR